MTRINMSVDFVLQRFFILDFQFEWVAWPIHDEVIAINDCNLETFLS